MMPRKKKSSDPLKELRARVARAPKKPGVYRWIGKSGEILYIGKAKDLRARLKSYVQKKQDRSIGPWKLALIQRISDVDWTITSTELEALILETNLIKELKPKYNVLMKDDKNYVYVRITVIDPYPTVTTVRRIENDNAKYFGPFLSANAIHHTLDMLHEVYGFRSCKRSLEILNKEEHNADLKPCLDSQIGKCNGLCKEELKKEEYCERIEAMQRFFRGDRSGVIAKLKERMQQAAEKKLFEQAGKLRDTLQYVESLDEKQIVSDTSGANTDTFGVVLLAGRAHVVVLRERGGKLIGERSFALAGHADTIGEVLAQFIPQYYTALQDYPESIIAAEKPDDKSTLETWLTEQGKRRMIIHVPERGKKSKLLQMAEENAEEKIKMQLASWEAATKKVEDALTELRDALSLPEKPKRIECFDISHFGGTETVGSMVVAINGKTEPLHYRSFTIRTMKEGDIDDYKALKEVLTRRLRHITENTIEWLKQIPITLEKKKKLYVLVHPELEGTYAERGFRYVRVPPKELKEKKQDDEIVMVFEAKKKADPSLTSHPDLLVLDGGKGQLGVGLDVLKQMKLDIPIISLAKREEEIFASGSLQPVAFNKESEAKFLLMRLRDEAHRCANRHREKRMTNHLTSIDLNYKHS